MAKSSNYREKTKGLDDVSDHSRRRKKFSNMRGNTKRELKQALERKKREEQDALIREINSKHPNPEEVTKRVDPPADDVQNDFDKFVGRKAV